MHARSCAISGHQAVDTVAHAGRPGAATTAGHAALDVPPAHLAMSGLRTYPQKIAVGSRPISRSRSSIRADGVIRS